MRVSPGRLSAALVVAGLVAFAGAGCASVGGTPASVTRTFRFASNADLGAWVRSGGDWRVEDGHAVGRSLYPQSDRYSWLTCREAFGEIERVVVHGGLAAGSPHNLRIGVGAVTVILNWEVSDANLVHYVGSDGHGAGSRALRPGVDSEIVIESRGVGTDRHVRLVVDDRLLWEGVGPPLMGTVTVYPALGSTIRVRDVTVTGRPATRIEVNGPSMPHF